MARRRPIVSYLSAPGDQDVYAQRRAVQAFAMANGFRVVEEFMDNGIAPSSRLQAALDRAQKESCPVLVSGLDWVSKYAGVVEEITARDVSVIVAGETPVVLRPYRGWSESVREQHGRKIKDALAARKAADVRLGNPVNLYQAGVAGRETQVARAETFAATVMPIIDEIRASGVTSFNAIAKELNHRDIKTARGGDFAAMSVKRIVERGGG